DAGRYPHGDAGDDLVRPRLPLVPVAVARRAPVIAGEQEGPVLHPRRVPAALLVDIGQIRVAQDDAFQYQLPRLVRIAVERPVSVIVAAVEARLGVEADLPGDRSGPMPLVAQAGLRLVEN